MCGANLSDDLLRCSRRTVLKQTVLGGVGYTLSGFLGVQALGVDVEKPPAGAEGLSAYVNQQNVYIRWNNSIIATYRAHAAAKYPYFSALTGPESGLSLVTESSLPYPHHRGIWFGCDPLNGTNYWDDASLEQSQILSNGPAVEQVTEKSVKFLDRCQWIGEGGNSQVEDERQFVFLVASDSVRAIDVNFVLTAKEDVTVPRAKHSFFALRVAPDISSIYGGTLMNSKRKTGATATFGQTAEWCGYHGKRSGTSLVEGIAILNHPDNFGGECPWFTRDYGHLSPSPFFFRQQPWKLAKGEHLKLKYCVVLHTGTPDDAALDELYDQWLGRRGPFV